jgi:phenol/toluene 2-monooxygenase (NADH) P5/A5
MAKFTGSGEVTYQVKVEPSGEVFEVEEGQTILDAALRSAVYLPHACSHGVCSTCKIVVAEGEVGIGAASPFALLDDERAEGMALACCATPLANLVIEADVEYEPDAERHKVGDFQAVVTSIQDLAPRIKSIFLAVAGDGLEFQAGQYINLSIPGLDGVPRAFSIASPPSSSNVIELNVALVEEGEATHYLHNTLQVGDVLSVSGPYGQFYVRKSLPEPIIFLAAGSGLSGVKSMVMELVENNDPRPITLIYGAHGEQEVYYRDLFEQYARERANFTLLLAVNDNNPLSCGDNQWGGLQELAYHHFEGKFEGYNAYVCGPPSMVDSCVATLMRGRCFEKHLFVEKFYNNSNKSGSSSRAVFKHI